MRIVKWHINKVVADLAALHYRSDIDSFWRHQEALQIIRHFTFDDVSSKIKIGDIDHLLSFLEKNFLKKRLSGNGLEVGSGPGTFSAILACRPLIKEMTAVEVCAPFVQLLMPKIVDFVAGKDGHKITGCIGNFDQLEIPNHSLDFIFDFFSLHHSSNICTTFKELFRVLRPGGLLLMIDKARPEYLTSEDLEKMLEWEYDNIFKKRIGYPSNQKLTRRMNGEKEYKLSDWKRAILDSGLVNFRHFYIAGCRGRLPFKLIKKIISHFPVSLQHKISWLVPSSKGLFSLSENNKIFSSTVNLFTRDVSLMIADRPN